MAAILFKIASAIAVVNILILIVDVGVLFASFLISDNFIIAFKLRFVCNSPMVMSFPSLATTIIYSVSGFMVIVGKV